MKVFFHRASLLLCMLTMSHTINAYDFMVDGLAYNILDEKSVEVTSTIRISFELVDTIDDFNLRYINPYWVIEGVKTENPPMGINYPNVSNSIAIPPNVSFQGQNYVVKQISDFAFAFTDITGIMIPPTITSIGKSAFENCIKLQRVDIKDIRAWVEIYFRGCIYYEGGFIDAGWDNLYVSHTSTGNPTEYAHHLYLNGEEVTSVVIPDDIPSLKGYTFYGCINLTEVVIPDTEKNLGVACLSGTGITKLPITCAMSEIPCDVFSNCPNLPDSIAIPRNIEFIGERAFHGSPINILLIPSTVKRIGEDAFSKTGLGVIYAESSDTRICSTDFYHDMLVERELPFDDNIFENSILRVPVGSIDNFRTENLLESEGGFEYNGWSFFTKMEEYSVPITAISLEPSITIYQKQPTELNVLFTPDKWIIDNVNWASSNPSVATIEDLGHGKCRVNPIIPGNTVITATTTDGSYLFAACVVTVLERVVESIELNITNQTLEIGQQFQLKAFERPFGTDAENIRWTSSDTIVATVTNNGLVSARNSGEAVISAINPDGLMASCIVSVVRPNVTSIEINKHEITLDIGQTYQLKAIECPSGLDAVDITWQSGNAKVASVKDGFVTAISPGTIYITAINLNGLRDSCIVFVPVPLTTGIVLSENDIKLFCGQHHQLSVTFKPNYAYSPVQWTSTDTRVVNVNSDGEITALAKGIAAVIATTTDGTNLSASCLIRVDEISQGDVNGDGKVDVEDVNVVINYILKINTNGDYPGNVDINGDGKIDVEDVNEIINLILFPSNYSRIQTYVVNGVTFDMVRVAGGTFNMGGTDEQGSDATNLEKPVHKVTLSNYSIGVTEVTQELWNAVMGHNPSEFNDNLQCPVECVSYDDCLEFIERLNEITKMSFRMPTEAEWEYAARGGNQSEKHKYSGDDEVLNVAWCGTNSERTHSVAQKNANELGLYDMSGNVWEWCSDWYGAYSAESQTNPKGPETGTFRVCRGGGWHSSVGNCRTSSRTYNAPTAATNRIGLRLAK